MPQFSIKTSFRQTWRLYKKNCLFFIGLTILTTGFRLAANYLVNLLDQPLIITIASLLSWLLSTAITIGLINISLSFIDTSTGNLKQLYSKTRLLGKYILGNILYGLIVFAGILLLIIPGIIWAIKYQFFGYLIIDQNLKPTQALKTSSQLTQGKKRRLFWLTILLFLFNLLGTLPVFLGLLITIPMSSLVMAHVYRQLKPPADSQGPQ